MIRAALFILLLYSSAMAIAQPYESKNKTFIVNQIKGCAPFTLEVDASTTCTSNCDITYTGRLEDSQTLNQTGSHTYTTPGNYTVRLYKGNIEADVIDITVVENILPEIEVFACGSNRVAVNVKDLNYDRYLINYNDGSAEVSVNKNSTSQHAFANTGAQTIEVRGMNNNAEDNCNATTKIVTTSNVILAPTISALEVLEIGSIGLEFTSQPDVQLRFEISTNSGTSFQQYRTGSNITRDTIRNIRTEDNYYCFRIGAFDPCSGQTVYSNTICSANFDLQMLNNENRLTWTTSNSGIANFRMNRTIPSNGQTINSTVSSSPYSDTDLVCGTNYCYQLTTNYGNGSRSVSLVKCGTAISNDIPTPISDISTIVQDQGVELTWPTVTDFTPAQFSIFKSSGNNFTLLSNTADYLFTDNSYSTGSGVCYKVSYTDACGNESPQSIEACPIALAGNVQSDNNISLSWPAYAGYESGVHHYSLEIYTITGTLLQSIDLNGTTYLDENGNLDEQMYVYVVKAIPNISGVVPSVSNKLLMIKDPNLFHPTAFTPNGDNLNDNFNVYGQYISQFEMDIFNRWGELMFSTTDLSAGWDGTFKGNPMPEGTYTFVATIVDLAGRTFKRSGSVLLLRKK